MKQELICLSIFIIMDLITGVLQAFFNKTYSSSKMREGLFHKVGIILVVILGIVIDYTQGFLDLGFTFPIFTAITVYVIVMEIGSIIENIYKLNSDLLPEKIMELFKVGNNGY